MIIPAFTSLTPQFADALESNLKTEGGQILVIQFVSAWDFDGDWYLRSNPDLENMSTAHFQSAWHHFMLAGYFEGRLPVEPDVDNNWYMSQYDDVAAAIVNGVFTDAREHYMTRGRAEGRVPSPPRLDPRWYFERYMMGSSSEKATAKACVEHFLASGYRSGAVPGPVEHAARPTS